MNEQLGSSSSSNLDRWAHSPDTNRPPLPQEEDADVRARIRAARSGASVNAQSETAPKENEGLERKINPENEGLPGNFEWSSALGRAAEHRIDQFNLWRTTLGERAAVTNEKINLSVATLKENLYSNRSSALQKREDYHARKRERLENSRLNTWPITRQILAVQTAYHTWREGANKKKVSRFDAKATKAASDAEVATGYKNLFEGRVAAKVERINKKWSAKMEAIQEPRDRINERIEELTSAISGHEETVRSLSLQIDSLERVRGGDRGKRSAMIREMRTRIRIAENEVEKGRDLYLEACAHRARLAEAHDSSRGVVKSLTDRYLEYLPTQSQDGGEADVTGNGDAQATETAPTLFEDIFVTTQELAESKAPITPTQFAKLWDTLFPSAKLPQGVKTLAALVRASIPDAGVDMENPESRISIKDALEMLKKLYGRSQDFRGLVKDAIGKKGINYVILAFESRIAHDKSFTKEA